MRRLVFTRQAAKSLRKLAGSHPEAARTIARRIERLRRDPMPRNSTRVVGYPCHRLRVGDYRIIYEFDNERLSVTLVEKREAIYRRLRRLYS
uniref:mRNA interferase RelE/StbE n=1 Tax=Candidatus Kentrum sp. TC TaxID=2126339 RepID=A0A450YLG6_9GAMM|nr:MAG: mRNA interferase RelE/StbE [Candidatus Kentron sp. TC]